MYAGPFGEAVPARSPCSPPINGAKSVIRPGINTAYKSVPAACSVGELRLAFFLSPLPPPLSSSVTPLPNPCCLIY